ncbi:MAG: hypothetical protein RLZZ350_807 [Verrucomicrobiota bacterium]
MKTVDLSQSNLSKRDFSGANLTGANLSGADLTGATFSFANLTSANLTSAKLVHADFFLATLNGAELCGADLRHARFLSANLVDTNLNGADLRIVNFFEANLNGTNFANVTMEWTSFSKLDLSNVKGLDFITHRGPSSIDIHTLYKSKGIIPESFLRGCGVPEKFIEHTSALVSDALPIQFYSVFISYSSKDQAFAERLHADLQSKKVRCWFAPEDLKTGDKFRVKIDEVIRIYDKLLLVLSKNSVGSDWVEKEVESAMEKERQQKRPMLFPIRLDDAVMKVETGWPADVRRTRHIGDFQNWKDHDSYQKAFNRLMRDLKADDKIH